MTQKYIVDDLVKVNLEDKKQVVSVIGYDPTYKKYLLSNKYIYETRGYIPVAKNRIMPIPITPEILEKNNFEHDTKYWSRTGINDQELYDYYKKKGLFSLVKDGNEYIIRFSPLLTIVIRYVHELQHLLFGLGINHEMEV